MYWLLLSGLFVCFAVSCWLENGKMAAPSVIVSFCLSLITMMAILGLGRWNTVALDLKGATVAAIMVGCVAFIVGCQFINLVYADTHHHAHSEASCLPLSRTVNAEPQNMRKHILLLATLGLMCSFLWYLLVSRAVGSTSPVVLSSALKAGQSDYESSIATALRCFCYAGCAFSCAILGWNIIEKNTHAIRISATMVLCTIVPPAVSSIRTNVLHILVGALVAISMARSIQHKARRLKAKNVLIAFIGCYALVQVFYLSVQFSGRVAHYNSPIDYIEYYLAGGIPALDYYLNNGLNPTGISETFWGLQDILQRLGIIASAAQKASEQWSVVNYTYDGVTNIYTFVRPALHDFGYVGMALYMALLGCLFQLLYRAAVTHHSVTSFIVYSYMAYILVESIRDDFFSYWLGLEGTVILVFLLLMKEYVWHTPYDNKRLRRKGMWNRSTNSLKPIRFSDHGDRA